MNPTYAISFWKDLQKPIQLRPFVCSWKLIILPILEGLCQNKAYRPMIIAIPLSLMLYHVRDIDASIHQLRCVYISLDMSFMKPHFIYPLFQGHQWCWRCALQPFNGASATISYQWKHYLQYDIYGHENKKCVRKCLKFSICCS